MDVGEALESPRTAGEEPVFTDGLSRIAFFGLDSDFVAADSFTVLDGLPSAGSANANNSITSGRWFFFCPVDLLVVERHGITSQKRAIGRHIEEPAAAPLATATAAESAAATTLLATTLLATTLLATTEAATATCLCHQLHN